MPCPHSLVGSPETCSMCRGATPRVVTRDPATGEVRLDGVAIDRPFALGGQTAKQTAYANRGARASGRVKRKR